MSCITRSCSFMNVPCTVQSANSTSFVLLQSDCKCLSHLCKWLRHWGDLKCRQLVTWRYYWDFKLLFILFILLFKRLLICSRFQLAGVIVHGAPGHIPHSPRPYTQQRVGALDSQAKVNENKRQNMHEMPHYKSIWIGCDVRPN